MCALFGSSSRKPVEINEALRVFAAHSADHPHGWGLAVFDGAAVGIAVGAVSPAVF